MIIIVGPIPNYKNEQDGMLQRIKAIDDLFSDQERVYISNVVPDMKFFLKETRRVLMGISTTMKPSSKSRIYKYASKKMAESFLHSAKAIYIHSISSANKIPFEVLSKYADKIILDIHGCAVEEMEYDGSYTREDINKTACLEKFVFEKAKALICVTEAMANFYAKKYALPQSKFIVLPMFSAGPTQLKPKLLKAKKTIIYAGTYLKWQNVDKMIELIACTHQNFEYRICTKDVSAFNKALSKKHIKNVPVYSVSPNNMVNEYASASYGLLLREDIAVNKVACPTKAIEYFSCGVIPIVLQPSIGDFEALGYSYIKYEDILNNKLPSKLDEQKMIENNYLIMDKLKCQKKTGEKYLLDVVNNI